MILCSHGVHGAMATPVQMFRQGYSYSAGRVSYFWRQKKSPQCKAFQYHRAIPKPFVSPLWLRTPHRYRRQHSSSTSNCIICLSHQVTFESPPGIKKNVQRTYSTWPGTMVRCFDTTPFRMQQLSRHRV